MVVVDFPAPLDPELSRQLRELPEFEPPAALWQRIAASATAAPPPRPHYGWPLAAAAAVAVLAVGLWFGIGNRRDAAPTVAVETSVPTTPAALVAPVAESQVTLRRRLDVLDRSLQQALDQKAPATDVAALAGERQRIAEALAQAIRSDATILTL